MKTVHFTIEPSVVKPDMRYLTTCEHLLGEPEHEPLEPMLLTVSELRDLRDAINASLSGAPADAEREADRLAAIRADPGFREDPDDPSTRCPALSVFFRDFEPQRCILPVGHDGSHETGPDANGVQIIFDTDQRPS